MKVSILILLVAMVLLLIVTMVLNSDNFKREYKGGKSDLNWRYEKILMFAKHDF